MESVIAGVVGAALGAVFTVGGTYWLSVHLDRQRARRQLHAAIGVVAAELDENSVRISGSTSPETLRERLTLGDWLASKSAFAGLALRGDEGRSLWESVARAYGAISDYRAKFSTEIPSADELSALARRLFDEQGALDQEIKAFIHRRPS